MAPSRPHPLVLYRARSQSEPNIPEMFNEDEPFLEEGGGAGGRGHGGGGGDILHASCNHLDLPRTDEKKAGTHHIPSRTYSFPPKSTPIDKTENIRNFLASLPNVTIEDDPGFGENLCGTSESGSGYSSPASSPTDDDHHRHSRYNKLAKEIRREHKETLMSAVEPQAQSHPQQGKGLEEETDGRAVEATTNQMDMAVEGVVLDKPETAPLKLESEASRAISSAVVLDQPETAPLKLESEASRAISSACQDMEKQEEGKEASSTAVIERLQPVAHIPIFQGIPKPLRSTSLPRNIVALYHQHPADAVSTHESLVAEHGSTNVSEIPSESNYEPSISPSEQSNQHRVAKADMDTSGPIIELPQIHSVPERIKEIEEMHSLKSLSKSPTVCESTLISTGERKNGTAETTAMEIEAQQSELKNEDDQNSLSRASSGHSISSLSAGDDELKQLTLMEEGSSSKTPPPPSYPHAAVMVTRHSSLSPNPLPLPLLRQGLGTEEHATRAASCSHLSQLTEPTIRTSTAPVSGGGVEEVAQFAQQLGSGAVKARVMDIEERNRDEKSTSSDELSVRRQSPPYQPRSASSSEVVVPPTAAPSYEARDLKQIVALHQQRRPSSDVIQERQLPVINLKSRRESTPPALFSAWSSLVDEVPTAPVHDLKKRFEDSDSVSVCSSVGSSGASGGSSKVHHHHHHHHHVPRQRVRSGNLRRTQSLRDMELPPAKVRHCFRMGGKNRGKFPPGNPGDRRRTSPISLD